MATTTTKKTQPKNITAETCMEPTCDNFPIGPDPLPIGEEPRLDGSLDKIWFNKIEDARESGSFTEADINEAGDWCKCVFGLSLKQNDRETHRGFNGDGHYVEDRFGTKTYNLGHDFDDAVKNHQINRAADIYHKLTKAMNGFWK